MGGRDGLAGEQEAGGGELVDSQVLTSRLGPQARRQEAGTIHDSGGMHDTQVVFHALHILEPETHS